MFGYELSHVFGRVAEWFKAPVLKPSFERPGLYLLVTVGATSFRFFDNLGSRCAAQSHIVLTRSVAIPVAIFYRH